MSVHLPEKGSRAYLVHSVSLLRIFSSLALALLVFHVHAPIIIVLYLVALASDYFDGWLARLIKVESSFGKSLDLIADKSLTAVSLLYAASRGIDLGPLAVIALRDLITLGMRAVLINEAQLLPTSRWFGAVLLVGVCGVNVVLLLTINDLAWTVCRALYWILGIVALANIISRFSTIWPAIQKLST